MGWFFEPSVEEKDNLIYVNHIKTKTMQYDIDRIFKTTRVNKYMFESIGRNSFVINSFFALELYYVLERLIRNRKIWSNAKELSIIRDKLLKNTWLANSTKDYPPRLNMERLNRFKWTPKDFQLRFLEHYSANITRLCLKGQLLAGAAGSGKTASTLFLGECLEADRIVIVAPKNAVYRVWKDTIENIYKVPQSCWIFDSGKPYKGERFAIFHYEALAHIDAYYKDLTFGKVFVILDESHNMNEIKSLRTIRFLEMCKALDAQDIILASGTPVKALSLETIPLFRAIDPLFTEAVETKFKRLYQGDVNTVTEILNERINNVTFKISKQELNLDEPVFRDLKVTIPDGNRFTLKNIAHDMELFIHERQQYYSSIKKESEKFFWECLDIAYKALLKERPSERKILEIENEKYHDYLETILGASKRGNLNSLGEVMAYCNRYEKESIIPYLPNKEMREKFKDVKSIVKYVVLKIRGECLGRVLGRKRIDVHLAMVPYIDFERIIGSTTKKTVIFTSYTEVVEATDKFLKDQDFTPITVYGKNTHELNNSVHVFEKAPSINPLIATYASLSTAVPLVMADTMVMINTPFRNYIFEQAVSRIHRLGADTQTAVFTISLDTGDEPNISTRTVDILKWSQDQFAKIMQVDVSYKVDEDDGDGIALECYPEIINEQLAFNNFEDQVSIEHFHEVQEIKVPLLNW